MPTQAYTAFISYSHTDGENFAQELKKKIAKDKKGKEVLFWHDSADMHSGNWSRQIETAIEQCEFLIMVITPVALLSPNCKDEWIYARKKGVMILPVNGLPADKDFYKQFPKWLEPQHIYNLDKQWQRFINDITTRPIRQPIPFMARRLAEVPNYVLRQDAISEIKSLLLDDKKNKISLTTSLQGSGGFGKTTLAIALCNDDEIINTFTDGILWVTLGQQPDILNSLKKLYEGLTGEQKAFIDIENARQKLQEAFEKRNCLLVIDDAWKRPDIKPIIDAANGITVLITTRITNLLSVEKYKAIKVDEMKTEEGTKLLTALFQEKVTDRQKFRDFSKKLGEWPLLLKLAGAQIQQRVLSGEDPEQALDYVQRKLERKGLHALDFEDSDMRDESVRICMHASIDLLDPSERDALIQLGIFPEDISIPFPIIEQLWEMDGFDAEELMKKMERHALIDIQLTTRSVSIHDVLLQYYSEDLKKNGLYQQLQVKLINSLGDFRFFSDVYTFRNYIWHLTEAGEIEKAKQILLSFEWLESKLAATDINSLLKDFRFIKKHADRNIELLSRALKASSYILAEDKNQLPVQLIGRLGSFTEEPIHQIVAKAGEWNRQPWLKPLTASMNPPTVLENVIQGIQNPDVPFLVHSGNIIFADWQQSIHIVELESGKLIYSFTEHQKMISALLIFREEFLVSGDGDGCIKIHDLNTNELVFSTVVAREYVSRLVANKDFVIGGTGDGTLFIIDMLHGFATSTYSKHTNSITSILSIGNYIISASPYDETLKLYDFFEPDLNLIDLKVKCETVAFHDSKVYYISGENIEVASFVNGQWKQLPSIPLLGNSSDHAIIYKDHLITTAGYDIAIINLKSQEVRYLTGHRDGITALFIKDDIIISGAFDTKLKVWSIESFEEIKTYIGHSYLINQIEAVGENIVSLEKNGQLFFWRYEKPAKAEEELDLIFYGEAYVHSRDYIIYVRSKEVIFLDIRNMSRHPFLLVDEWSSMDADDEHLFITESTGFISKINIESKQVLFRKEFGKNLIAGLTKNKIITRSEKKKDNVRFWTKEACEPVISITTKLQAEFFIEMHDKYLLLGQTYGDLIDIREIQTLEEIKTIKITGSYLKGVAVNDHSIIGILDTGIVTFDIATFRKKKLEHIASEKDGITSYTASEKYLAIALKDTTIAILNKNDFSLVQIFKGHEAGIETIKILQNTVISSGYDRSIYVWRIDDGEMITRLTLDERISNIDFNVNNKVLILYGQSGRIYLVQPTGFDY